MLGPRVSPTLPCPNAPHIPTCPGTAEITGSMSGMHGRTPSHGSLSTRSPNGSSLRATGSARSNCTGVALLSNRANSAPVASLMPARIGVSMNPLAMSISGWFSTAFPRRP